MKTLSKVIFAFVAMFCLASNVSAQGQYRVWKNGTYLQYSVNDVDSIVFFVPESGNEDKIVGTWKYEFSHGYCILVLKSNGNGYYFEYESKIDEKHTEIECEQEEISYSYSPDTKVLRWWKRMNVESDEEATITWVNDNEFTSDWDSGSTWKRQVAQHKVTDIVGSWKYERKNNKYGWLVLREDGSGIVYEYDPEEEQERGIEQEKIRYFYTPETGFFGYWRENKIGGGMGDEDEAGLIQWNDANSFASTMDSGSTWNKQARHQTSELVGSWKYDMGEGNYCLITFNSDGTGTYYEFDKGKEEENSNIYYSYSPETNYLCWGRSITDMDEDGFVTWQSNTVFSWTWDSGSLWKKEGTTTDVSSILGVWRYDMGEGTYCFLTFNVEGVGHYFEFDRKDGETQISEEDIFYSFNPETNYLCWGRSKNKLNEDGTITWNGNNQFEWTWDSGSTWIKQKSTSEKSIVGTWKYIFGNDKYTLLTLNADGTGHRYEHDFKDQKPQIIDEDIYYEFNPTTGELRYGTQPQKLDNESGIITWKGDDNFFWTADSGSMWIRVIE